LRAVDATHCGPIDHFADHEARLIAIIADFSVEHVPIDPGVTAFFNNASRYPATTAPKLSTVVSTKPTHSQSDARSEPGTGREMKRGALVHRRFSNVSAAVVVAAIISACSSSPGAARAQPEILPAGSAQVTINDQALPVTHAVTCMPAGSLTTITIGDTASGTYALVSNENTLTTKAVNINNLGGFSGSYTHGLDGKADVTMNGYTYTIRGSAEGFDTKNPSLRAAGTFTIKVAC
jgi:lipoprotein LpqH